MADRLPLAIALIAAYGLLCAFVMWRFRRRQRLQAEARKAVLDSVAFRVYPERLPAI